MAEPPSSGGRKQRVMFTVMTWNLENFARPAANAAEAAKERYSRKLKQISDLLSGAGPDLVAVQEILADHEDLGPRVFDDLLAALGAEWNGRLSHLLVRALDSIQSLPLDGIRSATADPASLANMEAPSDHRPVIARFNL